MTLNYKLQITNYRFCVIACLLLGITAQAQSKTEPVLILHSLCAPSSSAPAKTEKSCQTVITKEDFDGLVTALDPHMPESNRLVLATEYTKLLVLGKEAERLQLDQDPAFQQLMAFTRLQLLERQLVRKLEQQASQISAADIAQYYQQHLADFEEGSFLKLYIPKQGNWSASGPAEAIQKRAAGGENFDQLQQEVWSAQGRPSGAPATQTGLIRRSNLPEALRKIFDLKPGEVSALIDDAGAYSIYKLQAKRVIPLETVGGEVRTRMANQRLQDQISRLRSAVMVSVNEDYFGALPSTEELARHHGMEHQGSHLMPMSGAEKMSTPPRKP